MLSVGHHTFCLLSPVTGVRQDHRTAPRPNQGGGTGWKFFVEDEDEFRLDDLIATLIKGQGGQEGGGPHPVTSVGQEQPH